MSLHLKVDGAWVTCERPYVKQNDVWVGAHEAWVKRSGAWVMAYEYDVTPPNAPEISLNVVEDFDSQDGSKKLKSRWIRVGVRLPGGANDEDARLVRVLTDYAGEAPTTQFGGTYTAASDKTWENEPWSEWRYNSYGPHKDSSEYAYKQWPRNPDPGTIINGDKTYHFTGWALDANGNWSIATAAKIHIPKASVNVPNVIIKEARFQPNTSGSWRSTGFAAGDLIQQKSPRSQGLWFYGTQFTDSMGAHGAITVRDASIRISRADDGGQANANVYLFWTEYGSVGALPAVGANLNKHEVTKLGELAKGQTKWFTLPRAFKDELNKNLKGMGLDWKDPAKADAFPEDYSTVVSTAVDLRCGEAHVVWEEEL